MEGEVLEKLNAIGTLVFGWSTGDTRALCPAFLNRAPDGYRRVWCKILEYLREMISVTAKLIGDESEALKCVLFIDNLRGKEFITALEHANLVSMIDSFISLALSHYAILNMGSTMTAVERGCQLQEERYKSTVQEVPEIKITTLRRAKRAR